MTPGSYGLERACTGKGGGVAVERERVLLGVSWGWGAWLHKYVSDFLGTGIHWFRVGFGFAGALFPLLGRDTYTEGIEVSFCKQCLDFGTIRVFKSYYSRRG